MEDKNCIATKYNLPNSMIMESWLRTLNYVRNIVAHHSRLWNKNLIDQPKLPKLGEITAFDHLLGKDISNARVYVVMCILLYFMQYICPKSSWPMRLCKFIESFPAVLSVSIEDMGFPRDWKQQELWK